LTKTVNYAALDVTTAGGAEQLYQRLYFAARQVCAPDDGGTLAQKYRFRVCVDRAMADAIVRVDQPLVRNIHQSRNKSIRLASM
jgi:UrcA family protein